MISLGQAGLSGDRQALLIGVLAAVSLGAMWILDVTRPGSFRRRRARDVSILPWWGWFAAACAMVVSGQVGALAGFSAAHLAGYVGGGPGRLPLAGQAIVGAGHYAGQLSAGFAVLWALSRRLAPGKVRAAGLGVGGADVFAGLAWFLLWIPVVLLVMHLSAKAAVRVSGGELAPIAHETLKEIVESRREPWAWAVAALAIVGAPLAEELLYRVFLQSALLSLFRGAWIAILVASAAFAAVHTSVAPWHALPGLFVFGLGMAVAYERSRSPLVPMTMHALFNGLMIAYALVAA